MGRSFGDGFGKEAVQSMAARAGAREGGAGLDPRLERQSAIALDQGIDEVAAGAEEGKGLVDGRKERAERGEELHDGPFWRACRTARAVLVRLSAGLLGGLHIPYGKC